MLSALNLALMFKKSFIRMRQIWLLSSKRFIILLHVLCNTVSDGSNDAVARYVSFAQITCIGRLNKVSCNKVSLISLSPLFECLNTTLRTIENDILISLVIDSLLPNWKRLR